MSAKKEPKRKRSVMLYYDYIDQFELLNDKQLRSLIYAMVSFDQDGIEPELDPVTRMAFAFIKKRMVADKESYNHVCETNKQIALKRWHGEEEKDTNAYERIRMDTKNADKDKDMDIDKDIDNSNILNIDNSNKKDNINNSVCNNSTPTLDSIISFGASLGVDENYCKRFYTKYESVGWKAGKSPIVNWKAKLEDWVNEDIEKGNIKVKDVIEVKEDGFTYKNGKRCIQ